MHKQTLAIAIEDLKESEVFRSFVYDDTTYPSRRLYFGDCYREGSQYKSNRTGGTATIGYGETLADVVGLYWDVEMSEETALDLLTRRLENNYLGPALDLLDDPDALNPNQQAAIGSFAYNVGVGGWRGSTLREYINEGRLSREDISEAFHLWDNDDGSLTSRREKEIDRFFTPWERGTGMRIITREEAGLRPPRGWTQLYVASATVHYGGAGPGEMDHDECLAIWRAWQNQHMDTDQLAPGGGSDIAYNMGGCQHGYAIEGRGPGRRSGANGSNEGNSSSYAIVFIGGGDFFTDLAKDAINDAADYLGASIDRIHSDWVSTGCPGAPIGQWVREGAPRHTQSDTNEGAWLMALTDEEQAEALNILRSLREKNQFSNDVLHRLVGPFHPQGDAYGGAEGLAGWLAWMGQMELAIWNELTSEQQENVIRALPGGLDIITSRVLSGSIAANFSDLSDEPHNMSNELAAGH